MLQHLDDLDNRWGLMFWLSHPFCQVASTSGDHKEMKKLRPSLNRTAAPGLASARSMRWTWALFQKVKITGDWPEPTAVLQSWLKGPQLVKENSFYDLRKFWFWLIFGNLVTSGNLNTIWMVPHGSSPNWFAVNQVLLADGFTAWWSDYDHSGFCHHVLHTSIFWGQLFSYILVNFTEKKWTKCICQ